MTNTQPILLPKELEPFRKEIEATLKPTIQIKTSTSKPTIVQSKFAGNPYLPKTSDHPKDEQGKYMKMLAQINFEELPVRLEDMPEKGMLQFFLSGDHDAMGLDFDEQTNQKNFRVVFHADILNENEVVTDFSYMDTFDEETFPMENELSLSFSLVNEVVSIADRSFEDSFEDLDFDEVIDDNDTTLHEVYAENLTNDGHKIGGYAYFTQFDPREEEELYEDHDVLLLQIDSEDDQGIMWGDVGVGNFFIKKEDLKNRDFTNVLYNWDCC